MEQGMLPGMDIEETVSGIVDSIVFTNADNSYTVFRLKPLRQGARFTVTMNSAAPLVGQQGAVRGVSGVNSGQRQSASRRRRPFAGSNVFWRQVSLTE